MIDLHSPKLQIGLGIVSLLSVGGLVNSGTCSSALDYAAVVSTLALLTSTIAGCVVSVMAALQRDADSLWITRIVGDVCGDTALSGAQSFRTVVADLVSRLRAEQEAVTAAEQRTAQSELVKGQILTNVSHEFRTPLNAILGFTQLLKQTSLATGHQHEIQEIANAGQRLLGLISNLVDFSDFGEDAYIPGPAEVNVKHVIDDLVGRFLSVAEAADIRIQWTVDSDVPAIVRCDAIGLHRILDNLVDNAIKFGQKGGWVRLHVHGKKTVSGAYHLQISVTDNGCGMTPETMEHAFEPFWQRDSSRTRSVGGLGIGLALSRHIARFIGGELSVQSIAEMGAQFNLVIPVRVIAQIAAPVSVPLAVNKTSAGLSVLIVEDNVTNAKVLLKMLEGMQAEVVVAQDGRKALEELERRTFDLILMDCQMPIMDGLNFLTAKCL